MPLSPLVSGYADDVGVAPRVVAVDASDTDVDFGGLALRGSGSDPFAEGFQAPHLCRCPISSMIAVPSFPSCAAFLADIGEDCVSRDRGRAVFPPKPPVLADRDDSLGLVLENGGVAAAGAQAGSGCRPPGWR